MLEFSPQWPTLTVVIPSFNQGDTLEQTLKSILDHNHLSGLEVLIFDAMSTDSTPEILQAWEARCTVVREKDRGQSDAIHKGFIKARFAHPISIVSAFKNTTKY